ncbi:palmitoyltransferase ZDHHC4 [Gastrophryne carolinensis]
MDFLWLFLIYVSVLIVGVSAFCYMAGRSRSRLDSTLYRAEEALSYVLPEWLSSHMTRCFHTRNATFVVLHLLLDVLVFGEYLWEVQGYSLEMELPRALVFLPYAFMTVNLYFFYKCCTTDPGRITSSNERHCIRFYRYDNLMFRPGRICETCHLLKPARSKHCGVCGKCVQRFDHHCVWVNNCIGVQNMRYFLLYLMSLLLTAVTLAGVIAGFLLQVVLLSHMMSAAYVDSEGHEELVGIVFIIQHLFMTFPRIVLSLGFLLTILLLLGCYTCFMCYLCTTNQTTNEWYKARSLRSSSAPVPITSYSRGIVFNLQEVFLPCTCYKKKQKE